MNHYKDIFEKLSPVLIDADWGSIKVELSKRFLLFELLRELTRKIEDDPYLNFISILKYYKVLGNYLHGDIRELHRDKDKPYFRDFFHDPELYKIVSEDLDWAISVNSKLNLTITKSGVIVYDNYRKNKFNAFLLTVHSGSWMPKSIKAKQALSAEERKLEEDVATHKLYVNLVLKKSGIWIDNKMSRYACDYNRPRKRSIYTDHGERWLRFVWKEKLTKEENRWLMACYDEFYFTLAKLVETYRFNIIFDGHSMSDDEGRPDISFGTVHIPRFYLPIVIAMKQKLESQGYYSVDVNAPYGGGHILNWMGKRFPNTFTFSMEVNKRLYMDASRKRVSEKRLFEVSNSLLSIFNL